MSDGERFMSGTTRRGFLKAGVLTGAGLLLEGLPNGLVALAQAPEGDDMFSPNPWLRIDRSGQVSIFVARSEMGQGVRTSLPMIVAEELEVDLASVTIVQASPGSRYPSMRTSGSGSVMGGWPVLRLAGASAREMLIEAAAAEWVVPVTECRAERGEVVHPGSGRRVPYGELVEKAAALPVPPNPPLKTSFQRVGQPTGRLDAPAIVNGSALYGLDVRVPGMKYATIERPPHFGATLAGFDPAKAVAVPGVRQVVAVPSGVAVVADTTWSALQGRSALEVEWTPGADAAFDSKVYSERMTAATLEPGLSARSQGDVEAAFNGAPRRLDAVYEYGFQVHAPLEPMNCIADVRADRCEIWTGTQAANQAHAAVAERLDLDATAVLIHIPLLGGGFGRRLGLDFILEAVEVSKAVGGPVQVVWTRDDDMKHGFFHPASVNRMSAALDAAGRPIAWRHAQAGSPLTPLRKPDLSDPDLARDLMWGGTDNPYAFPAMDVTFSVVESPVPTGPWRAVFYPTGVLARECFLDEIAHAGGVDPLAARIELLGGAVAEGEGGRLVRVLKAAAERAGWGTALPAGRGRGVAVNLYHGATAMAQVAEVSVTNGRVSVHRIVCAVDCGTVVNPLGLEGQIESAIIWGLSATLHGGITFTGGRANQTSFGDYPVVTMADTPAIEVVILSSDYPPMGMGEQPVAPVAAAVLNAVFAASGKRVRRCPATREDLL
jgi:isoquinoline 1-oxidoreductase beta subunit